MSRTAQRASGFALHSAPMGARGRAPAERSGIGSVGVVPKRALARIVFSTGASLGRWCDRGWPYVDKTGGRRGLLPRSSLRSASPATLGARQPLSAVLDVPGRRAAGANSANPFVVRAFPAGAFEFHPPRNWSDPASPLSLSITFNPHLLRCLALVPTTSLQKTSHLRAPSSRSD